VTLSFLVRSLFLATGLASGVAPVSAQQMPAAVLHSEFVFLQAPFAQSHASTLAETRTGLVAAWFGGPHEKSPDTGIWLARRDAHGWSAPVLVADGVQSGGRRFPSWNPVLIQPRTGPLLLFYKVGPDPRRWWGMLATSPDGGRSWSVPRRLPGGILGPAKNPPLRLANDELLSPASDEQGAWRVHLERSDGADRWQRTAALADPEGVRAIQPALLAWPDGRLQLLARSRSGRIVQSASADGGASWSALAPTALLNPNSGIDARVLRDGRALLVYNPTTWRRSPLVVAVSDDGERWRDALTLEDGWGEYSYPTLLESADGLVHVVYTWRRERIKHVVIDPAALGR
jgi:predicted neuraminidase